MVGRSEKVCGMTEKDTRKNRSHFRGSHWISEITNHSSPIEKLARGFQTATKEQRENFDGVKISSANNKFFQHFNQFRSASKRFGHWLRTLGIAPSVVPLASGAMAGLSAHLIFQPYNRKPE